MGSAASGVRSPCGVQTVFVDHAAEILGVSRRTVYYWIRDGKLRTVRKPNGSQRVLIVSIETQLQEEVASRALAGMRRRAGATVVTSL